MHDADCQPHKLQPQRLHVCTLDLPMMLIFKARQALADLNCATHLHLHNMETT